jgi:hypothetical protein
MNTNITDTVTNSPDVEQAINTLAKAFLPHVSSEQVEAVIGAIFILARVARKAIPDQYQTALLGTILKHLALEINPQLGIKVPSNSLPSKSSAPITPV